MANKHLLALLSAFTLLSAHAQQRKYVNDYLNLGVGGRGTAMSGSQVASVNDVTSAFWNPAGMSYVKTDLQVGLMHSEYFSGIAKYDYMGTAFKMKNRQGALGFSVIRYAIDDIPYTLNLVQPDGSIDYTRIKAISAQDYAGMITYAQPLRLKRFADRKDVDIRIGGNFKIIHRSLGSMANAWGGGVDIGVQARVKNWRLGAVIKDATTTYTMWSFSFTDKEKQVFAQTGNEIVSKSTEIATPRLILGGARNFRINAKMNVLAELNADVTTDGKRYGNLVNLKPFSIDPRVGGELAYNQLFYVRAGIGNFQRVLDDKDTNNVTKILLFQPTLGLGVKIKNFAIDYSFSRLNMQSNSLYSHFISLRVDILRKGSASDVSASEKAPDAGDTPEKKTNK